MMKSPGLVGFCLRACYRCSVCCIALLVYSPASASLISRPCLFNSEDLAEPRKSPSSAPPPQKKNSQSPIQLDPLVRTPESVTSSISPSFSRSTQPVERIPWITVSSLSIASNKTSVVCQAKQTRNLPGDCSRWLWPGVRTRPASEKKNLLRACGKKREGGVRKKNPQISIRTRGQNISCKL